MEGFGVGIGRTVKLWHLDFTSIPSLPIRAHWPIWVLLLGETQGSPLILLQGAGHLSDWVVE